MLYPGLAIGLFVFSINLMGDGLRDAMDPKLRK
jgi:ABC-type dipeptide/oligopeptide/nickel transport system permease subunit